MQKTRLAATFVIATICVAATESLAAGWTSKPSTPAPVVTHGVAAHGTRLYSIGGATSFACCNVFTAPTTFHEVGTSSWTAGATMNVRRKNLAVVEAGGLIYAIGGDNDFSHFTTNEAYNPATNSWAARAPMPTPRSFPVAAVVDGIIYVIGGENSLGPRRAVEAYDPATNSWTSKAPMLTEHSRGPVFGVVGKTIYIGGGMTATGANTATMEAYDTGTNTWSFRAPLSGPRNGMATAVAGEKIYSIGGHNGSALANVDVYDPASDSWTAGPALPAPRFSASAATVDGVIYAVGGMGGSPVRILSTVEALEVQPAVPPTISAPGVVTAEATSGQGASVSFVVTASGAGGSVPVSCSPASGSLFPVGTTQVTCTATDGGLTTTAAFDVVVSDTTPPSISSVFASPSRITARNHKMVPVTLFVSAHDLADPSPSARIVSVSMTESRNGDGGSNHDPDWEITGPLSLLVRAERPANLERIYTILIEVSDRYGNAATATLTVAVGR